MALKFYRLKDPGGYMSNYYRARFFIYNRWWDTVEHAYQAQKTYVAAEYDAIHQAKTANDARLLGQKVQFRQRWDEIFKDQVMEECLRAKFLQHKNLRDQLIATGEEELIENSPYDSYWGCGKDGDGKNMLGKLLMRIRQELAGE
jgi:N-glycosidase YbiA